MEVNRPIQVRLPHTIQSRTQDFTYIRPYDASHCVSNIYLKYNLNLSFVFDDRTMLSGHISADIFPCMLAGGVSS